MTKDVRVSDFVQTPLTNGRGRAKGLSGSVTRRDSFHCPLEPKRRPLWLMTKRMPLCPCPTNHTKAARDAHKVAVRIRCFQPRGLQDPGTLQASCRLWAHAFASLWPAMWQGKSSDSNHCFAWTLVARSFGQLHVVINQTCFPWVPKG